MKKALQHMKSLVIVESPAKAKTIAKYLGKDYTVKASVGHIMDLPKSKLGVDIENDFKPRYIVINKKAILQAIEHPGKIDVNKVDAQQARRVLDRLVGYQISPILWKKVRRGLSAGRGQSVTVRLVCERGKEGRAFVSQEYLSF